MTIRRPAATVLGAAALLAVTLTAAHAESAELRASSTTDVDVTAQTPFTATTRLIEISGGGTTLTCEGGVAEGTAPDPSLGGTGHIMTTRFDDCQGTTGTSIDITQNGTWAFTFLGDTTDGVTPGVIHEVSATLADEAGLCSFDIVGTLSASFDANTQQVTADNTSGPDSLFVENVEGCFGLVLEGDSMTVTSTYQVRTGTTIIGPT